MNVIGLTGNAVAPLAAISFAGSAGAGPLLCEDVTLHAPVQSSCPDSDNYHVKNKHRIDYLFDAGTPTFPSVLSDDWSNFQIKFKPGKKLDERLLHHWDPLWSSGGWSFGRVVDYGGRMTQMQLHRGQSSRNVPEPGPLILMGIGLVGAALSRRLKRT